MPRGRLTTMRPVLDIQDQVDLLTVLLQDTASPRYKRRADLILTLAKGGTVTQAAAAVGISRIKAYTWLRRWQERRTQGLLHGKD